MEKNLILTRAQGAVLSRDFTTAVRLYKQLLNSDPSNVDYLKEVGSIYVKAGQDEKAIPYYEQIIMFYPHYIEAMNSLGAIFRRLKRYDESVAILLKALDEGRQIPSINYNLGFTYKEMGQYDDAIEAFDYVIAEKPDDVLAYNHLGVLYLAKKEYQKSIAAFKRGLQVDPNHPILNYNLARCYDECKMYSESIRCYQSALKAKPGWVDAVKDFSSLLVKCQQTKEAADLVSHSIELHPNDVKMLCLLGNIYLNQYDFDSAVKTFKKAKSYKASDVEVLTGLANALEKDAMLSESISEIEQALEIEPDNKDVKKQYVSSLLSAHEYDNAHAVVEGLYRGGGDKDPQVLDLYGQYYICSNNEAKAQEMYKKLASVNPLYKNYMLGAAERYNQIGQVNKAIGMAKNYISKDSKNSAGYNTLGKIYTQAGHYQDAIEAYEKSRSLSGTNVFADKQLGSLRVKAELLTKPSEDIKIEESVSTDLEDDIALGEDVAVENEVAATEEFDFSQMGDNVLMTEALQESEDEFFDSLDEEESEQSEEKDEAVPEEEEDFDFEKYSDPFNDYQNGEAALSSSADDENKDSDIFGDNKNQNMEEDSLPQEVPLEKPAESQIPSATKQESPSDNGISEEQARQLEDRLRNSTEQAMLAAMDAQRKVHELELEQEKLRAENEALVKKAVEEAFEKQEDEEVEESQEENILEEPAEDSSYIPEENAEEEEVIEEDSAEDDVEEISGSNEIEESNAGENLLNPAMMLQKIEAILKDDDEAKDHAEELGLFIKLKELCEYLPENEKDSFASCRARMLIEFLIAKYSGKPGLLLTATSLIKSGVLGVEVSRNLAEENDEDLSNELIKRVIQSMKKLSSGLEDKNLQTALCLSADGILEKIELENQKSQIF
ncbi:MAG: tetratricopeptide repeat protein [Treponema sp.]|nr:tetratricopeptide repeat protein [Treponema sp.]